MNKPILAMLSVLIVGCTAVGKDYVRPDLAVDKSFVNATLNGFSEQGIEQEFWKGFNDDLLNSLIDEARKSNHDLRIAKANLREVRALRREVGYDQFPTVTANAAYTKSKQSLNQFGGFTGIELKSEAYTASFDAIWELDIFGRVQRGVQAADADVAATEAGLNDVEISVAAEVAREYFQLRGLQKQLDTAKQNYNNQQQTYELTVARLDAGRGTELDRARAKAQLDTTLSTIPTFEASVAQAIYRLSVLTGQQPVALAPRLTEAQPLPSLPSLINVETPDALLRRRPDIRRAERSLAAQTARIGVATADLFPRVTLGGDVGFNVRTLADVGKSGSDIYSFGPNISWAFLNLGRVRAGIQASKARTDAALALYEQTVLRALEETEGALIGFNRAEARKVSLQSAAEQSEIAARLARERFDAGVTDFLTVLDAERRLLEDQNQLVQGQTAAAVSLVAVYKALGGGWKSAGN
ncbi:MAG TPA: efflux transporter outer membrane subunit [Rhizobacter sp.]|nr:efflux transporter outer membrane subunit [Rhizobacter sp.]